ncbi:helicase HerA domain-containing protein [uncultured Trichococcus sp.]|uniref:ATP-binding protein n=1 Tax=uncultured Trichococcus sp. TaxID=189665 RepID=UPI002A1885DE|nr:DUF87 domain-containing protein [uncultured Trichococcus sp.]
MNKMSQLVNKDLYSDTPISILTNFLNQEREKIEKRQTNEMRFVGYVLEIGFETAKIITSDPYKAAVGGIPRGSFLIMVPKQFAENIPPHFSLLRVNDVASTPLSMQVQQTYFELHKKSMPELDIWTQSELRWGALECDVLGTFYPNPEDSSKIEFSGDVNNIVSAHNYEIFSPDQNVLDLIVNGIVPKNNQFNLGNLRSLECRLSLNIREEKETIPVKISMEDFKGTRTAMFGKTRLGKSNVVKLLAQGMIDAHGHGQVKVGQLIFDINGEYANDNPQDGGKSLRSLNEEACKVYALTKRDSTPSKQLRINFYEYPAAGIEILAKFLQTDGMDSIYIKNFASAAESIINPDHINSLPRNDQKRAAVKILIYWAILSKAGFDVDDNKLSPLLITGLGNNGPKGFNPKFNKEVRDKIYGDVKKPDIISIADLKSELDKIIEYTRKSSSEGLKSSSGNPLFDADDEALLNFYKPKTGVGPAVLSKYRQFHSKNATDFTKEIVDYLDAGSTVILDLGNAQDSVRKYFSDMLSKEVFRHQETKFVNSNLNEDYIQLYFEEAHNLFPPNSTDNQDIYSRFAKEGAKFHIGMVYSTQSPSTISKELLAQTENFFVSHLSSTDEVKALAKMQIAYEGIGQDILKSKTPGFMRILTMSNRFVVPVQAKLFKELIPKEG